MANAIYPKAKEQLLQGGIDMSSGTIKVALIDTADEAYNSADEFFSDVTGAGVVGSAGVCAKEAAPKVASATANSIRFMRSLLVDGRPASMPHAQVHRAGACVKPAQRVASCLRIKQIGHLSTGFSQALPQARWTTREESVAIA